MHRDTNTGFFLEYFGLSFRLGKWLFGHHRGCKRVHARYHRLSEENIPVVLELVRSSSPRIRGLPSLLVLLCAP